MRLTDPLEAARRHRMVLPFAVALLAAITFSIAFFAERLQRDPDVRDLLPRRSTVLLVDVRPGDGAALWKDQPAMRLVRTEVERLYAAHGVRASFDSERQGGGLVWIARPRSIATIAYCRCAAPPLGSRTIGGFTFVSDDDAALLELAPAAGATLADDPAILQAERVLPGGAAMRIVAQPVLAVPLLGDLHHSHRDVDALLGLLPSLASTWPTIVAAAHVSDGAAAVTVALPHRLTVMNEPLALQSDASGVAMANPVQLLSGTGIFGGAPPSPLFVWPAGAPPLYRPVIESARAGVTLAAGGVSVTSWRPIGWSTERPLIESQLREYIRAKTATVRALSLPGGGSAQELYGLPDAELPVMEEIDGTLSIEHGGAQAAARTGGPELQLFFGVRKITASPSDAPQQRILRARLRAEDVSSLSRSLSALAPSLIEPLRRGERLWKIAGLNAVELDVGVTEESDLVRVRWR